VSVVGLPESDDTRSLTWLLTGKEKKEKSYEKLGYFIKTI
jgi:hypothetical protein